MISALDIKELYENACGYALYCDIGEIESAVRKKNEVFYPVCGLFKMQPMQVTAIRSPIIGVASADIEIIAPTHMLEEVRAKLNTSVVTELNGASVILRDEQNESVYYSVSFTVQTCTVGEKLDIGAWYGECATLRQTVSFVIIEEGVSAYDTALKIDGMNVPILTLAETKVHTTSVYSDSRAIGSTASELEAYGIDFTTPYIKSELCELFHNAVNCREGNRAHCVEITKNGITNAYIMAISSASDTVQPPSNIGFNISLTEINTNVGRFDGRWCRYAHRGDIINQSSVNANLFRDKTYPMVVFWGDGEADIIEGAEDIPYHVYSDGIQRHDIMCFRGYSLNAMRDIKMGDALFGKTLTVSLNNSYYSNILPANEMFERMSSSDAAVIFGYAGGNEIKYSDSQTDALVYGWSDRRIFFCSESGSNVIAVGRQIEGEDCFVNGSSFVCPIRSPINKIRTGGYIKFLVRISDLEEEVIK